MFDRVFEPHREGHFTLPDDLLVELRGVEAVRAALSETVAAPDDVVTPAKAEFIEQTLAAARAGESLPGVEGVIEAERRLHEAQLALALQDHALERAEDGLAARAMEGYVSIITDHLRPALNALLAVATEVAADVEVVQLDADGVVLSEKAEGAALGRLRLLGPAYNAIYDAHAALTTPLVKADRPPRFRRFRNFDQLWPRHDAGTKPPWPQEVGPRLLWIVTSDAVPWIPLPEEQDAAARAYGEKRRKAQQTPTKNLLRTS